MCTHLHFLIRVASHLRMDFFFQSCAQNLRISKLTRIDCLQSQTATNNELPKECDVALIQEGAMYPKGLKDSSADCAM
jgi:hypothetical protein